VFPLVVGEHCGDVGALTRRVKAALEPIGRQWGATGPVTQAVSGVDIALWDLLGQAAGLSVSRLLGARTRSTIGVYASSLGPQNVAEQARRCREAAFPAVKIKLGFGRELDEANLSTARDVLGADVAIYADANQAWTLQEAVAMAPVLAAFDVAWIEEPLAGDRLCDLEDLHRATGLSIATGENLYGLDAFRSYIDSPAIEILQPDVTKTGDLTEAWSISAYAASKQKTVIPHMYGGAVGYAATLQLAACAPNIVAVEYDVRDNPLRDPLLIEPPCVSDGSVALPDAPGLGIELNHDAISALTNPPDDSNQSRTSRTAR
jgi:L-alanine-DL-glutamate epimerase-like enolase superfamily enzyme